MTIAVLGLGLMGASLAGALAGFRAASIVGMDIDEGARRIAEKRGYVRRAYASAAEAVREADWVIFAVYAKQLPGLLAEAAPALKTGALLSDICGVKCPLYAEILPKLPAGVFYTGLHPMAGRERDGIEHADPALYEGSSMLVCPTAKSGPEDVALARAASAHIGAARFEVVEPDMHDAIIAYTSDLMHISAAGLCLSPHPGMTRAFTAGAWRDCTRVANINAAAWTELLLSNRANVLAQLDAYLAALGGIRTALEAQDAATLEDLLQRAGDHKREMLKK